MSIDYAKTKIAEALCSLATSAKPIQHRLAAAGPILVSLEPGDFPDADDRELFGRIMAALNAQAPEGVLGSIETSAHAMDDEAAEGVARDIAALHGSLFPPYS